MRDVDEGEGYTTAARKRSLPQLCLDCGVGALLWVFCTGLAGLLLVQCLVLGAILSGRTVRVPDFAIAPFIEQWQQQGLVLGFDEVIFSFGGELIVDGIAFSLPKEQEPFASIERLRIDLDFSGLLLGRTAVEKIDWQGLRVFEPAWSSLSGRREEIVADGRGTIGVGGDSVSVQSVTARLFETPLILRGELARPLPFLRPGNDEPTVSFDSAVRDSFAAVRELRRWTRGLSRAQLDLWITQPAGAFPSVRAVLRAEAFSDRERKLEIAQPRAWASLRRGPDSWLPEGLGLEARSFSLRDELVLKDAAIFAEPRGFSLNALPEQLKLMASRGRWQNYEVRDLALALQSWEGRLAGNGLLFFAGKPVRVAGAVNPLNVSGRLRLSTRADASSLEPFAEGPAGDFIDDLRLAGELGVSAQLQLAPGGRPDYAAFELWSGQASYRGVALDSWHARGYWTEKQLNIPEVVLNHPGGRVEASFFQRIEAFPRFRLAAQGAINPQALYPVMPPWWEDVFGQFSFNGPLPEFDMAVRGRWGMRHSRRWFTSIALKEARFRGVPMRVAEARAWGIPNLVVLDRMDVSRDGEDIQGSIAWVGWDDAARLRSTHFDLRGVVGVSALQQIFSRGALAEALAAFESKHAVQLDAGGMVHGSFRPAMKDQDTFDISFHHPKPITFKGVLLDELRAMITGVGPVLRGEISELGFADGMATGDFRIREADDVEVLSLDAVLEDASQQLALERLPSIFGTAELGPAPASLAANAGHRSARVALAENGVPGTSRFDLSLQATGPLGAMDSFTGSGELTIRDDNLARLRLFGPLTRLLENTPLPIGAVRLRALQGVFTLALGRLDFSSVEILGPATRIAGEGHLDIRSGALDFRLRVFPLGEVKVPLVTQLGQVLSPLSHALEVTVRGTLENPLPRLMVDPRGAGPILGETVPAENTGVEADADTAAN